MSAPEGLFISRQIFDQREILEFLVKPTFTPITNNPGSRAVLQYGSGYGYAHGDREIPVADIPDILQKLHRNVFGDQITFSSIIVNRYENDQGISEHRDSSQFGPIITCLIVGDGAEIEFRKAGEEYKIYLKGGDAYIMSGQARSVWTHQIRKRRYDLVDGVKVPRGVRYSITYRS